MKPRCQAGAERFRNITFILRSGSKIFVFTLVFKELFQRYLCRSCELISWRPQDFGGHLVKNLVWHKEISGQWRVGIVRIGVEFGDAFVPQNQLINEEIAAALAAVAGQDDVSRIGHDFRFAAHLGHAVAAKQIANRRRINGRKRPEGIDRNVVL